MHFFDIIILIFTAVFTGLGIKRGFIGELFRCAAVVAGFATAFLYYRQLSAALTFISMPPSAKTALSFLLVYAGTALTVLGIGWVAKKIVRMTMLGWADRLLGGCVGLIKSLILTWILMLCIALVPGTPLHSAISHSCTFTTYTAIPLHLRSSSPLLPASINIGKPIAKIRTVKKNLDNFKEKVDSAKAFSDSLLNRHPGHKE
jgi:membrane protein required for colicin V production